MKNAKRSGEAGVLNRSLLCKKLFCGLCDSCAIHPIIVKYFFLDRQSFFSNFENEEKALLAMDSSAGSEHDIYEPWEAYSVYLEMIRTTLSSGLDYKKFRFQEMPADQLNALRRKLSRIPGATNMHIERFLHLVDDEPR